MPEKLPRGRLEKCNVLLLFPNQPPMQQSRVKNPALPGGAFVNQEGSYLALLRSAIIPALCVGIWQVFVTILVVLQ